MTVAPSSALRQALAAILLVGLTLSGVGRATAMVDGPAVVAETLAGVTVHICHSATSDPAGPLPPGHGDRCDLCALCAPVALPGGTPLATPVRVAQRAARVHVLFRVPVVARVPDPRSSQGPPTP